MRKLQIPLSKAHKIISPRIAYIVTTIDPKSRVNAAVFSNLTSVSTQPERLVLGVYKSWDTIKNIKETREFVVNVPSKQLIDKVLICGDKYAGNPIPTGINELSIAGLTEISSEKVKPPRIKECYGHLECKVVWIKDVGDHYLVLSDIIAASFTQGIFNQNYAQDIKVSQPLMEISNGFFTFPEKTIKVDRNKLKKF